ncbi:PAS domain-containing protein [Halorubrum laminariae]|uniref:histidine kinase n=1 Tax=Halorubrum laminariae TaxID=1433523 RepID=A0ABD6C1F7_9EURY|nr:PAS domain S-box protein [Halorubrum laminariae]
MCERVDPETLIDLAQDKVVVLDDDGVYRYCNAAVVDILGFEPEELIGADAFELVYPEDRARVRAVFDAIVAGDRETDEPFEYRYGTADGDWVWLRTMVYTPAETGIDGYVLTSRDVTEEVESRRRLETIASASADVFWMFSADWSELLFVNDAVENVYGVSAETLERRPQSFLDAVHPDDRPYVERAMSQLSKGESTHVDYRLGTEEGSTTWVRVPGEPVIENGDVVAVTGFARDVTEEYRRERQLAVMDNLLRHTIRNDMNIVDGTAAQIADRVADARRRDDGDASGGNDADRDDATGSGPGSLPPGFADAVTDHVETIQRVADDLLTTAEKQRGVIEMLNQRRSPRPIALEPAVEAAVEMVDDDHDGPVATDCTRSVVGQSDSAQGAGTPDGGNVESDDWNDGGNVGFDDGSGDGTARANVADAAGVTDADESVPRLVASCQPDVRAFTHPEIDYAIAELVANAVDHATSTPAVRIDVSAVADTVDISVWDNCEPIPPEERSAVTDRWEMDDINHTNGMGLWLVYWVADRSGGDIAFDTHDDGNVVTLSLPNADCDETENTSTPTGDDDRPAIRDLSAISND